MAQLRASNLAKAYRGREVIHDVSVEIESGQIVGLLGPNGAGKTTCFYMIIGIIPADRGVITVNGEDITGLTMHQRARRGEQLVVFPGGAAQFPQAMAQVHVALAQDADLPLHQGDRGPTRVGHAQLGDKGRVALEEARIGLEEGRYGAVRYLCGGGEGGSRRRG